MSHFASYRWFLAFLAFLLVPLSAWAHALGAECWIRNGQLEVKAFFSDGTRPQDARVDLIDEAGVRVAQGRTDQHGLCVLSVPNAGHYRVMIDAGGGHRITKRVQVQPHHLSADASASKVSEGADEEEFTAFPWAKVAIGLVAIAGFAVVLWLARRQSRHGPPGKNEGT